MNLEAIEFSMQTWRNTWLMKPENYSRFCWELFVMVFLIALGFLLPYINSFEPENSQLSTTVDYLSYSIFSFDIAINFNTGFYQKGALVMDRVQIFKEYLSFWFWIDIVSTVPIDKLAEIGSTNNSGSSSLLKYIRVLRVLKLIKLIRLTKLKLMIIKIKDRISNKKLLSLITVFKLLLYLFLIAHFFACLMYSISSDNLSPNSFMYLVLNKTGKQLTSNGEIYATCLYWAITTMASIGYGDLTPMSTNERIFGILTMICSSFTFGFIIGNIGTIVEKQGQKEKERRETMTELNYFMKVNSFSPDLRAKTRRYMEYAFAHQQRSSMKTIDMLSMLSEPLQQEILEQTNGHMLNSKEIFKNLGKSFVGKLTRILEVRIFSPGDQLIKEGFYPKGMFFIITGFVNVYDESTRSRIKNLGENDIVGEIGLFTKQSCVATVVAGMFIETYFIDINIFYQTVEQYTNIKELVARVKENCVEGNYTALCIRCYICGTMGHIAKNCKEIKNQEQSKKNWIRNKVFGKRFQPPDPEQKPKRNIRKTIANYTKLNVAGKPRKPKEMFPHYSRLVNSVFNYFSRMRKSSENHSYHYVNYTEESGGNSSFRSSMNATINLRMDKINKIMEESDEEFVHEHVRDAGFDTCLLK